MNTPTQPLACINKAILSKLIDIAREHVQDIESGIDEGRYFASENQDLDDKRKAVEAAQAVYTHGGTPRVLVVVSGGIADPTHDEGVDVEVFDWDNYNDDPEGTGGVPPHFKDLAEGCGIPVNEAESVTQFAGSIPGHSSDPGSEIFPGATLEEIGSVMMQNIVGDYDAPEFIHEWQWVERNASFSHRDNGQPGGVWEFVLNMANSFNDIPEKLLPVLSEAKAKGLGYVVFHQGT